MPEDLPIYALPAADLPLSGQEKIPISQNGVTKEVAVENLPTSSGQLDSNELAAVQNANAPTGSNPFATINDLPTLSNNVTVLTRAQLQTLVANGTVSIQVCYQVSNAVGNTRQIRVFGLTSNSVTTNAINVTTGEWGNYDLDADVFTPTIAYKEWVGLLNSTDGTDMTITELSNNLGEAITVTFDSGLFTITKATNFVLNKTAINIGTASNSWAQFQSKAVSGCDFSFVDISGSAQLTLEYVPISVRIYP